MAKISKTNVMRILDQAKLPYQVYQDGQRVAELSSQDLEAHPSRVEVFKTLVTVSKSKEYYVFMIPVPTTLDLKKAAQTVDEKAIAMIKEKELLPLTGYVHGGCSPIGMKKAFRTCIDQSAKKYDQIRFSAGKVGYSVQMKLSDLESVVELTLADLTVDEG